jgi:hypothetical protein
LNKNKKKKKREVEINFIVVLVATIVVEDLGIFMITNKN